MRTGTHALGCHTRSRPNLRDRCGRRKHMASYRPPAGGERPGLADDRGGKADSMFNREQAVCPPHSPDTGQAPAPVNGDNIAVRFMTELEWRPPDAFEEYRLVRLLGR